METTLKISIKHALRDGNTLRETFQKGHKLFIPDALIELARRTKIDLNFLTLHVEEVKRISHSVD